MKKTVSFLSLSIFLVANAYAGEKVVVASAAGAQPIKVAVVKRPAKVAVAKQPAEKTYPDYSLEAFSCCGLSQ